MYCDDDAEPLKLPQLEGVAVLNIGSYAGGAVLWQGHKPQLGNSNILLVL